MLENDQKVLLVDDDNQSLLRSLRRSLSSETYEVILAKNVQHAIAKSEEGEIDLLHRRYIAPFHYPMPQSRWGINE